MLLALLLCGALSLPAAARNGSHLSAVDTSAAADPIHIVYSTDLSYFVATWAAMRSLSFHCSRPKRIHVFVLLAQEDIPSFQRELACRDGPRWGLGSIQPIAVNRKDLRDAPKEKVIPGRLGSLLNYARFYLSALLPPTVRKLLYVDVDTLVLGDVQTLWDGLLPPVEDDWLCAVNYRERGQGGFRGIGHGYRKSQPVFAKRYGRELNLSLPDFNAGVMAFNLRRWVQIGMAAEVEFWLRRAGEAIYRKGSQSPLTLALLGKGAQGTCIDLPVEWNSHTTNRDHWTAGQQLVHWNGRHKPWRKDEPGPARNAWLAANPPACGGHGTCQPPSLSTGKPCMCFPGSTRQGVANCVPRNKSIVSGLGPAGAALARAAPSAPL